jgi:hypothetical protein
MESFYNLNERQHGAQNTIEAFIFENKINWKPNKKGSRGHSKTGLLNVVSKSHA